MYDFHSGSNKLEGVQTCNGKRSAMVMKWKGRLRYLLWTIWSKNQSKRVKLCQTHERNPHHQMPGACLAYCQSRAPSPSLRSKWPFFPQGRSKKLKKIYKNVTKDCRIDFQPRLPLYKILLSNGVTKFWLLVIAWKCFSCISEPF